MNPNIKVTIGLTESTFSEKVNYSSFSAGYLPGADQQVFEVEVTDEGGYGDLEDIGWVVFKATNDPTAEEQAGPVGNLARAIIRLRRTVMRSLSNGDTITVDGETIALQHSSFEPVELAPADEDLLAESVRVFWAARKGAIVDSLMGKD
jgi:hypothetical protein